MGVWGCPFRVAIQTLVAGTTSRGLWAHYGLLLGNTVRPTSWLKAACPRGPTRLPPTAISRQASRRPPRLGLRVGRSGPGRWGRPHGGGTRLGARASERTMTPSPLAAAASPTPAPLQPPGKPISHSGRQNPAAPRIVPPSARPPSLALITLSRLTALRAARQTPHSPPPPGPASQKERKSSALPRPG